MITKQSIDEFTAALASVEPTPGGGTVAALAGALAASLGAMCANCGLARGEDAVLGAFLTEAEALRGDFLQLAECDSETYRAYTTLRALPEESPTRAAALEGGLLALAQTPMTTLRFACRTVALLERLLPRSSAALRPDIAVAASLCRSALASAAVTLRANTSRMKDRNTAEALEQEAQMRFAQYDPRAEALFRAVYGGEDQ